MFVIRWTGNQGLESRLQQDSSRPECPAVLLAFRCSRSCVQRRGLGAGQRRSDSGLLTKAWTEKGK